MIPRVVLDTEAFVLYLLANEGGTIKSLLREADAGRRQVLMNVYNLAEVYVHLAARLSDDALDHITRVVQALPIHRVAAADPLVFAAARLRVRYGVEAATAIAWATALQEDAVLVTGQHLERVPEGLAVRTLVSGAEVSELQALLAGSG